jgi:hypothetical protein
VDAAYCSGEECRSAAAAVRGIDAGVLVFIRPTSAEVLTISNVEFACLVIAVGGYGKHSGRLIRVSGSDASMNTPIRPALKGSRAARDDVHRVNASSRAEPLV